MPKVVREDIDALNAVLTITIEKEDYEPGFKKELSKLKDKAAIRGFRRGKTPMGFLKKMYGKGLLGEIVSDMLQKELSGVMNSDEISVLGQPLPVEGQQPVNFDQNNLDTYSFKFELGKAPDFDVKGLGAENVYQVYKVEVPAEKVEERLDFIRKRRGERVETDGPIEGTDMIAFSAVELDGDAPKDNGWKTTFSILFNRVAEGPVKEELKNKKKGDAIRFNIYELEEGIERENVKKYLLNFTKADLEEGTETGEMYEATIESVTRVVPAELTQELFDQMFGEGEVTSEAEFRDKIAENLATDHQGQVDSLLYRDLRKRLTKLNRDAMPLPNDFIKRWLKASQEKDADKLINDYDNFADDMRWTLIKNKLYKQYNFEVSEEEIKDVAYNRVAGYFGGYYDPKMLEPVVKRMLEDPESVNGLASDVLTDKLFRQLKSEIMLMEVPISEADFKEKHEAVMDEEEERAKLRKGPVASDEEE
ncbi:MAG: hypothetical protein HY842_06185 [Bacteroidetes bacterium]|nr:hypothetical protein [Bacteroidota bacterium]